MKRVFIVGHGGKPEIREMVTRVTPWLAARCEIVGTQLELDDPLRPPDCDLVLVFGGDGSILAVARQLQECDVPVVGVNLGRVGFLAEIPAQKFEQSIARILDGEGRVSERLMLECRLTRPGGDALGPFTALNDVVIARSGHSHSIDFEIWIDGEQVSEYSGDGLIVSTPTGSTGYNLSAGGPLISPRVEAFVIAPMCPHSLTNRPVVIGADEKIEIRMPTDPLRARDALMTADGQVREPLGAGGIVRVNRSARTFRLLTLGEPGYYEFLREKLHWGRSVKRER